MKTKAVECYCSKTAFRQVKQKDEKYKDNFWMKVILKLTVTRLAAAKDNIQSWEHSLAHIRNCNCILKQK